MGSFHHCPHYHSVSFCIACPIPLVSRHVGFGLFDGTSVFHDSGSMAITRIPTPITADFACPVVWYRPRVIVRDNSVLREIEDLIFVERSCDGLVDVFPIQSSFQFFIRIVKNVRKDIGVNWIIFDFINLATTIINDRFGWTLKSNISVLTDRKLPTSRSRRGLFYAILWCHYHVFALVLIVFFVVCFLTCLHKGMIVSSVIESCSWGTFVLRTT